LLIFFFLFFVLKKDFRWLCLTRRISRFH